MNKNLHSCVKILVLCLYLLQEDYTPSPALPFPCIYWVPSFVNPDVALREVFALYVCVVICTACTLLVIHTPWTPSGSPTRARGTRPPRARRETRTCVQKIVRATWRLISLDLFFRHYCFVLFSLEILIVAYGILKSGFVRKLLTSHGLPT